MTGAEDGLGIVPMTGVRMAGDSDLPGVVATLAEAFDRELERWRTFGIEPLVRRWLAAAHPVGTALRVHDAEGQPTSGRFAGLAADGSLLLRLEDGTTRAIHAGDVTLG